MTKRENENLGWMMGNFSPSVAVLFLLKDSCAMGYLASQKAGLEGTFIARLVMLPGSLLFGDMRPGPQSCSTFCSVRW